MTLPDLEQELTMLARLHDGLTRFRDTAESSALQAAVASRARDAMERACRAALAQPDPAEEWLYVYGAECWAFDDVRVVEMRVNADFAQGAANRLRYDAMKLGDVAVFCPYPGRYYTIGRFPRGTVNL